MIAPVAVSIVLRKALRTHTENVQEIAKFQQKINEANRGKRCHELHSDTKETVTVRLLLLLLRLVPRLQLQLQFQLHVLPAHTVSPVHRLAGTAQLRRCHTRTAVQLRRNWSTRGELLHEQPRQLDARWRLDDSTKVARHGEHNATLLLLLSPLEIGTTLTYLLISTARENIKA